MHSSARYLLDDYWTQLSDCTWRYFEDPESWRPVLMDAQQAIPSAEKEASLHG
tara:strand:+ start:716 stop:874 length:159 start_codon:yes stop_codon:yes gene_type:complete